MCCVDVVDDGWELGAAVSITIRLEEGRDLAMEGRGGGAMVGGDGGGDSSLSRGTGILGGAGAIGL